MKARTKLAATAHAFLCGALLALILAALVAISRIPATTRQNAAYIDGFAGGTLGISVEALKPLIAEAQKPLLKTKPARAEVASDESSATDFSVPAVSDSLR